MYLAKDGSKHLSVWPETVALFDTGNPVCLVAPEGNITEQDHANADLIAAAPVFFAATAGELDLLDQPIDWVSALAARHSALIEWLETTGWEDEDPDATSQMFSAVSRLVSGVREAIAIATDQK